MYIVPFMPSAKHDGYGVGVNGKKIQTETLPEIVGSPVVSDVLEVTFPILPAETGDTPRPTAEIIKN